MELSKPMDEEILFQHHKEKRQAAIKGFLNKAMGDPAGLLDALEVVIQITRPS